MNKKFLGGLLAATLAAFAFEACSPAHKARTQGTSQQSYRVVVSQSWISLLSPSPMS